jgi:CheY-like chemotaxis protein
MRQALESRSILLVEDNVQYANALAELLQREGFTLHVKTTAADALTHVTTCPPDLLLLDVRLPDISGDEMLHLARERCPGLPAIVLTGYPRDHESVRAILAEPSSAYLEKPATLEDLFALVTEMLGLRNSRDS